MATEPIHPPGCECSKYGCRLRRKGVQVSHKGMERHNRKPPGSNAEYNGWERGIATEKRPNGTVMPYINGTGDYVGVKAMAQGDHAKDLAALDRLRAGSGTTTKE